MNQIMDIVKLNEFNLLKKEVDQFGPQSQTLDCENRRLKHLVKILKNLNDVYKCIIALLSLDVSTEKTDKLSQGFKER